MIGRTWRAMLAAAPVRLWAQIVAAGSFLAFIVSISIYIRFGRWSPMVEKDRVNSLFWLGIAVCFLLLFALAAITEQRFGLRISKDGFTSDVERDDEHEPHTLDVTGQMTVTPQPTKGDE